MKPQWQKYILYASMLIIAGSLLFILIETGRAKNTGFETKTLWDWMELLVIPFVLALGAFALNRSEKNIERQSLEARANLEREIATDRQQEAALQTYLDRMTDLLLKEELAISDNEKVRNVARIRTLTILRSLDAKRKRYVLLLLIEAGLIDSQKETIIDMFGADFTGADLSSAVLVNTNLAGADFTGADLSSAFLAHTNLTGADLSNANLRDADFDYTKLIEAKLVNANLRGVDFTGLRGPGLPSEIFDADLSLADLIGSRISDEQLSSIKSLKGTIMPDGSIHP